MRSVENPLDKSGVNNDDIPTLCDLVNIMWDIDHNRGGGFHLPRRLAQNKVMSQSMKVNKYLIISWFRQMMEARVVKQKSHSELVRCLEYQ